MSKHLAVVLAAGQGTRMKSDLPKVLVDVCGRPMIMYVLDALREGGVDETVVVVGYRSELVRQRLAGVPNLTFVEQTEQLGTGHAVMVCQETLRTHQGPVLVVTGDSPMIQSTSVRKLLDEFDRTQPACIIGTAITDDPAGLGRIVRDEQGDFVAIVEHGDATEEQRQIREVNMSTYVFECRELLVALDALKTDNAQGEYYITDCPGILKRRGCDVRALGVLEPCESLSINTIEQLAVVEAALRNQQ